MFLAIKMVTKFVGILPLTRVFRFVPREGMYTTLMMSTGLTFGSISALFGLTNHIIDQRQYTILVTAVIGSAVVPTLIAQRWFQPGAGSPGRRRVPRSARCPDPRRRATNRQGRRSNPSSPVPQSPSGPPCPAGTGRRAGGFGLRIGFTIGENP